VKTHFAWGADFGASIDLGGDEMTCIDFDVMFGMRRGWIKFLGIGAQADIMVSNSCRSFPLYAEFRTNFRNSPSILFWDLKYRSFRLHGSGRESCAWPQFQLAHSGRLYIQAAPHSGGR